MQSRPLEAAPVPIREDLAAAFAATCSEFAEPGAWLAGTQRLAVAAEARNAWDCALCRRRKDALSPYGIEGDHLHLGALADGWVDVVHRIVTDSGRITERWYRSVVPEPIPADVFIEILSVATLVTCCDVFNSGIGIAREDSR